MDVKFFCLNRELKLLIFGEGRAIVAINIVQNRAIKEVVSQDDRGLSGLHRAAQVKDDELITTAM